MKIRLYQINPERDKDGIYLKSYSPNNEPKASIYDEVFRGVVDCDDLEDVFTLFNTFPPMVHRGNAMSVSDVVVVEDTDFAGKVNAYYCDAIGFKKIDFDYMSIKPDPSKFMRVVYAEPGKEAYETYIGRDLQSMQKAVGDGFIEPIWIEDDTCIIGNDSAKLIGMQGNRHINNGHSVIAGPFFVCGDDGDIFTDLSDSQTQKYLQEYKVPEIISQQEVENDMKFEVFEM